MSEPKTSRFVFNDETKKNSYGFKILTKGISLERFKKNPVMLDGHWNSNWSVLGSWEKVKKDKTTLSGVPLFDTEDDNVIYVKGKVERGFIKTCSMGVSFNREDLKLVNDELVLTKCELYEVSIVAVPSNANSIRLYAPDSNEKLKDEDIQELCLSLQTTEEVTPQNPKQKTETKDDMKITLLKGANLALGFGESQEVDTAELSAKIIALEAQKAAAELKLSNFVTQQETAKLQAITAKVDLAIKEGKFPAEKKQALINLGVANEELFETTLGLTKGKASLAKQILTPEGSADIKTVDDFQKLSHDEQIAFKQTSPEAYQKLFTNK